MTNDGRVKTFPTANRSLQLSALSIPQTTLKTLLWRTKTRLLRFASVFNPEHMVAYDMPDSKIPKYADKSFL